MSFRPDSRPRYFAVLAHHRPPLITSCAISVRAEQMACVEYYMTFLQIDLR